VFAASLNLAACLPVCRVQMGNPERGEAWLRHRWRLSLLTLAVALGSLQSSPVAGAEEPSIKPAENPAGFAWSPSSATVPPGGTVAFRNPSKIVAHGVAWTSGPEKPSCSGVPVDSSGTDWSGTCALTQPGIYDFVCTVHGEMKGSIVVGSGEAGPAPPGEPAPEGSQGRPFRSLQLAKAQQGPEVRGSIVLSEAAAGARLVVALWARRNALGAAGEGRTRAGRLVRLRVKPGRRTFAVPLTGTARRALRNRGRLSVSVQVEVKPPEGSKATATRKVELHG
jgi:plastocyanin